MKRFTESILREVAPKRKPGYLKAVLAAARPLPGGWLELSDEDFDGLRAKYAAQPPAGPGTELKALLKTIGITAKPNCSCNKRAKVMDEKGCDWCEENIDEIDGWLAEESKKRKLPYLSLAGKTLIRLAIRRARKKGNGQ
jgi:hypothetical protein